MQKSAWVFLFTISFALGIAFRSFFDFGIAFSFFFIFLSIILLLLFHSKVLENFGMKNIGMTGAIGAAGACFFLFAFGLGMLRFDIADLEQGDPALEAQAGSEVIVQGIIADEPDVREGHTKLTLRVRSIDTNIRMYANDTNSTNIVDSKVLVITEHYPDSRYGDEVIVRGKIQKPKNFPKDPSEMERPFNYVEWLAKDGIFYQMFYPEIERIGENKGNPIRAALFALKHAMLQNLSRVVPEPHASLAGGITLGTKQSLGEELLDAFRATGIIHIVVLSGYNVTIVAEAFGRIAAFMPRLLGIGISSFLICAFALMTGAGATIVRASLMALLVLLARATGRAYEITVALFAAGFAMLLSNPKILMYDPSFQLSFLATFGLLQLAPRIEKFFGWIPTRWRIREVATATLATQIFVLPLLLFMMGTVSVVALLVNLLILPFIPLTMFSTFAAMFIGFISDTLSLPFSYFSYFLLEYELMVVDTFAALPFADVSVASFSWWKMLTLYMLLGIFLRALARRKKRIAGTS